MDNHPLVLFDGICNLCNTAVGFILKHDRKKQFRFVAMQSETGQKLSAHFRIPPDNETVVLIYRKQVYTHSDAALEIFRLLNLPWRLAYFLVIFPRKFRDSIYRQVTKNRYRWFGRQQTCRIPGPDEKRSFPEYGDLQF